MSDFEACRVLVEWHLVLFTFLSCEISTVRFRKKQIFSATWIWLNGFQSEDLMNLSRQIVDCETGQRDYNYL